MYKVVIADDDEIQLEGMCTAFPWEELEIEVAAGVDDGDKALQAVIDKQADILLTDIKMTNMDGLYLTEQIRKLCPQTRVVIMSAYDDFQFAQKALRLGVDDYLLKPIDLTQMKNTMRQIVIQKNKTKKCEEADRQYYNKNHTINKTLAEHLSKLVLMGNTEMLPEYIEKLKNNLRIAGNDSILMLSFSLSSILGELRELFLLCEPQADRQGEIYYNIIRKNSLDDAIELLGTELTKLAKIARSQEYATAEQSIGKACEYIEKHFSDPDLRIGEIAAEVGLSQSYFSSVFAEATGESFTDYLIKRRMKEAQILLMNSDYQIQEIGFRSGYDNPAYFSAAFKKFTGVSVSKYKEMIRGTER